MGKHSETRKRYYEENKEAILKRCREYKAENKLGNEAKRKAYRESHKEEKAAYDKRRGSGNSCKTAESVIVSRLRARVRCAVGAQGARRMHKTEDLVGCGVAKLKEHLQHTALSNGYKGFDINSYSGAEYHIDHIDPCSGFDLSEAGEQKKCFNYTNLQILTAEANLKKGCSVAKTRNVA